MVTDYEAAWVELQAYVASKTQHGREPTLAKMAELADAHRVPAGELSRLLRLYGIEVERVRSMSVEHDRAEAVPFAGGLASPADDDLAGHHDRGGHDGSSNAGEGRRRDTAPVG